MTKEELFRKILKLSPDKQAPPTKCNVCAQFFVRLTAGKHIF